MEPKATHTGRNPQPNTEKKTARSPPPAVSFSLRCFNLLIWIILRKRLSFLFFSRSSGARH